MNNFNQEKMKEIFKKTSDDINKAAEGKPFAIQCGGVTHLFNGATVEDLEKLEDEL